MTVPEIDIEGLEQARDAGAALIDVREPHEYEEFHAEGARLIPLGQLADRVAEVPSEGTVYLICRTGARSAKGVEQLLSQGIDAVNVVGGSLAWRAAGKPVIAGPEPG